MDISGRNIYSELLNKCYSLHLGLSQIEALQ